DGTVGVTHHINHGIDVVIGQGGSLLGRIELGSQREGVGIPAHGIHHHFHGIALAGTRVTDVDALVRKISEVFNAGVGPGDNGQRLTMHGEQCTHVFPGAIGFEVGFTVVSAILNIGLYNAHIELAALHAIDVGYRTTRGWCVATDVVLVTTHDHHAADTLDT